MGYISLGDVLQLVAIVFFAGAFWQRTGMLNETIKEMKTSFDTSIKALTNRVNDHGEKIAEISGRIGGGL